MSDRRDYVREATRSVCSHLLLHPDWLQGKAAKAVATTFGLQHGAEEHQRKGGLETGTKAAARNVGRQGCMMNMKQPTYPRAKIWALRTPVGSWDDATFVMCLQCSSMAPWILGFKHSCLSSALLSGSPCVLQCASKCSTHHGEQTCSSDGSHLESPTAVTTRAGEMLWGSWVVGNKTALGLLIARAIRGNTKTTSKAVSPAG